MHSSGSDDGSASSSSDSDSAQRTRHAMEDAQLFGEVRDSVQLHPRVKHARRALKLARKMDNITKSTAFQKAMSSHRLSDSDDDDNDNDDDLNLSEDIFDRGGQDSAQRRAAVAERQQRQRQQQELQRQREMAVRESMALGLESLQTDSESAFSSEKLCREFSATARLATSVVSNTDAIIETVLEERSPHWTNGDIQTHCRDSAMIGDALRQQCTSLLECSNSFCGAAERVLAGAREEVRSVNGDLVALSGAADACHRALEEKKSKLAKELKIADDLRAANASRSLCLLSEDTDGAAPSSPSSQRGGHHAMLGPMRARLRMLMSASMMQIRGLKASEEATATTTTTSPGAGAGTTRVLNAFEVILNSL